MTNRSKSCPPDSRSGSNKRRVELGSAMRGRMPLSIWLGGRKDHEEQDRGTNSQQYFVAKSSLQGLFSEPFEESESKSNSDSSYTNLSETEASWVLAFDDIMSQVSSRVSGVDELLEVLSIDGEDPSRPDYYAITVETKNPPLLPFRKKNNRSKEDSSKATMNAIQSLFFACADDFTIEGKLKCMDSSDFWETLRNTCSAHCDDTEDFMEIIQAKSREKMEIISRFDSGRDGSPVLRTSSGRRVQFEFDMNPIPLWAQRSWRRRSGLHVIPKTNNDKATATMQSCLKNPMLKRSDDTSRPNSRTPRQGYEAARTNKVERQPIGQAPSIPSETAAQDNAASRNSIVTAIPQAKCQKQNSCLTKLKIFVNVAAVARKVLPLTKKSVVPREQVNPKRDGTEIEISALPHTSYRVPMDCGPHTVALERRKPKPPDPPALSAPLAPTKPQQTHRAVPKLQETPLAPSRSPATLLVPTKTNETNYQVTPLRLRVQKVNSDIAPRKESTSTGSQSSNNSTLLEDWTSSSSKTSEESAGLKYRQVERRLADPSGVYSPQKDSLEGLTIECQKRFEGDEGQFDADKRRDNQPSSSQPPNKTIPQTPTKGEDIHSNSLQKPLKMNSQTSNKRKQLESVALQKPKAVVHALSSQPANATKKHIARKPKSEATSPLVAQQKIDSGCETNNWFNFHELDENGFPTNHLRVDGKGVQHRGDP